MLSVEDHYYKLNRILLKTFGIWPYRNSKWTYVQMIAITTFYLSMIFAQLAVLVTHDFTFKLLIDVLSFALPSIFVLGIYQVYYFRADTFKEIMEHMYYDWKVLKNKIEVDILDDYACSAKLFTKIFTLFIFIITSMIILFHLVPIFLNAFLSLNDKRPVQHIKTEYFVDQYKYDYLFIHLHISTFLSLAMFTTLAAGAASYSYGLHACAIFKITNYRMEIMINNDILRLPSPERECIIFERLVCAVDLHRRNLLFVYTFCNFLMDRLSGPFLVLLITGVASLSICMFRLFQAIEAYNDMLELIISSGVVIAHIIFIFFSNHWGQQITNNNSEIFETVYKMQWYVVSLDIQKLMLFLLQNGYKDLYISTGGVFNASYEGFTTLITSAISYFTVIHAIQ